ncbi:MAG: hypothetical protein ACOYYS_19600, partial [Chloroflexota bacterium]
ILTMRKRLSFLMLFLLLGSILFGYIEGIRILLIKIELNRLGKLARHYAVSGYYDDALCKTPAVLDRAIQVLRDDYGITTISYTLNLSPTEAIVDASLLLQLDGDGEVDCRLDREMFSSGYTWLSVYDAWAGGARMHTLEDRIKQEALPMMLDKNRIQIHLCSDRPGYSYNEENHQCTPQDDIGRSYDGGDEMRIELSYEYPLGSFFGLDIKRLRFSAVYTGRADCYRVGCIGGMVFKFSKPITTDYTLEIFSMEQGWQVVECPYSDAPDPFGCSRESVRVQVAEPPRV